MLTTDILAGAGLLAAVLLALLQFVKPFLPARLQGDQRDAAVRLLALGAGAVLQVAVYLFSATHVTRPDLGAAIALGAGSGLAAILSFHGGTLALGAVRQGPAVQATPPVVTKIEQVAAAGPAFPPEVAP